MTTTFYINLPYVRMDFCSLLRCDRGVLVCGTAARSECATHVKPWNTEASNIP